MNAIQTEVSDGTLHTVQVGIEFFGQADIQVSLSSSIVPLVVGNDYQWTAATTITFLPTTATPAGLVPAGATVTLIRKTENDSMLNTYDGGAPFSRLTLDENFLQLLRLSQEFSEGLGLTGLRQNLDMHGNRLVNVGDPVLPGDATNKNYVDELITDLVESGQGPGNSAVNVTFIAPDSTLKNLQQLSSTIGADMIGDADWLGRPTTVGAQLQLINQGTIYADDPVYGGSLPAAVAAMGANTVLVIRQPYTLTEPLRLVNKTNPVVVCTGAGKINGSRTGFTFPTANARGVLHFDNCSNPTAFRVDIKGARTAKSTFGADVTQDGDAGIEYYQCSSPRTFECKVDQVLTWGVIHVGCTDTKANYNKLTRMTRQSGIGHASVVGGECVGNFINYSGLYGIEVEGPGNTDIRVYNNTVRNCLKGIAVIGSINSCEIKFNNVSLCTYLIQLDANGASNTQVGVEVFGNRTYDGLFHYYLKDTTFVDVTGNTGLGRVASAYIPQRAADQVVSVISSTVVLIADSTSGTIAVGDVHYYSEGVARTVQAVDNPTTTPNIHPVYGACWRVTYTTADTSIGFGSFFLRNQVLAGAGSWFHMSGTRNGNINVDKNSVNAPLGYGLNLNGNMNALRWGQNRMVGVSTGFYAGDTTAITNSAIVVKRGDIPAPGVALVGGAAPQKLFPSMIGEIRTLNMRSDSSRPSNNPLLVATSGISQAFRLRVNIVGSTKTANTGTASVTLNGTPVGSIPASSLGGADIVLDLPVNALAGTHRINLADTYGDMGFMSASFELHTLEV